MGPFIGGCFSFVAIIFALAFFIQNPPVFWGILVALAIFAVLAFISGKDQLPTQGTRFPPVPDSDDDFEGAIRHHHYQRDKPDQDSSAGPRAGALAEPVPEEPEIYEIDTDDERE